MTIKQGVLLDDPNPELFCGLCHDIMENPIQVHCREDHIFCSDCIEKYMQESSSCPVCLTPLDRSLFQPSKFAQRQIGRLRTRCIYHEVGCSWQGTYSDDHADQCEYVMLPCANADKGCTETPRRMDVERHRSECPFEILTCPNGVAMCEPFFRKDSALHESTCRSFPCQYAEEGCPFIGTLPEVNAHCDVYCGKLHKRIDELESECKRLKLMLSKYEPDNGDVNAMQPETSTSLDTTHQADTLAGYDLFQNMFPNDTLTPFPSLPGNEDKTASSANIMGGDFMDFNDWASFIPAFAPPSTSSSLQSTPAVSEALPLPNVTPSSTPATVPKRSSNGKIIRYRKNVRLAHSALRMARHSQRANHASDDLLDNLDVAKPIPRHSSDHAVSMELSKQLAQQSLSSPQNSPFPFKNLDDVSKFLNDIPMEDNPPTPASGSKLTTTADNSHTQVRLRQGAGTSDNKKDKKKVERKPERKPDHAASPVSSALSPTNPSSPAASDAPKRRPMFVLASSYLAGYNSNHNDSSDA